MLMPARGIGSLKPSAFCGEDTRSEIGPAETCSDGRRFDTRFRH
jgi:hypothetical protein